MKKTLKIPDCPIEIIDAAVTFAFDHGPLGKAIQGDPISRLTVGLKLEETLSDYGLKVIKKTKEHA